MADATSDASTSASEVEFTAQDQGADSATEDAQAEQLLGDALDGQAEDGQAEDDPAGADHLGDPGKRALETMKGQLRDSRDQLRDSQDRVRELESQLAETQQTGQDAPDRDAIRAEVASQYNHRVLAAELQRAATGKLADPADALTFLNLDQFEVGEDGAVDGEAITTAVDGLIASKPYLAAATGTRFQGTGDGGARNGATPKQITSRDELANMSYSDRLQAYQDGRLSTLLNS